GPFVVRSRPVRHDAFWRQRSIVLARSARGMKRREALMLGSMVFLGGCMGPSIRSQSPEEINAAGSDTQLIGDLAVPFGLYPLTVESVGLVTGLPGTGSDP